MTWSYSGNPSSSVNDEVRFLVGDTDTNSQKISDEEIAYLLTQYPAPLSAASAAANSIAAKFSCLVDEKTGDISKSNSQLADQYRKLAIDLQGRLSETDMDIFAGGISISDVDGRNSDTDRVQEEFEIGQDDNNRTYNSSNAEN